MKYKVKIRKSFFWKNLTVIGHRFDKETNRMDFYLENGGIISYGKWDQYDMKLGKDWVVATQKLMEKESGQAVRLNV